MKTIILFFAFIIFSNFLWSQDKVNAFYYYSLFSDIDKKPYIETYTAIVGSSLIYMPVGDGFQGQVEITMIFSREGVVKSFNKYVLSSPKETDKDKKSNFVDLQRIALESGVYNFEMKIRDVNNSKGKEIVFYDVFTAGISNQHIDFSGIQYIEKISETQTDNILSKNGYDMVPYVSDFFPETVSKLKIYTEIYQTDTFVGLDKSFLIKYGIEKISTEQFLDEYSIVKKVKSAKILPIIADITIENLPSGNYHFRLDVIDQNNKILATKRSFFQRSNPKSSIVTYDKEKIEAISVEGTFVEKIKDQDTLNEYLKCILPIAGDREKSVILNAVKNDEVHNKQVIFLSFWRSRNYTQPNEEWELYFKQVVYVNKQYGSKIKRGYESDRGRVYLQYGMPNNVNASAHEPAAYPYEIWHYHILGNQRNKRFVFCNSSIVGNDYELIHSDAFGEIYDKNWERRLSKRNNALPNPDETQSDNQWGSKAKELFEK